MSKRIYDRRSPMEAVNPEWKRLERVVDAVLNNLTDAEVHTLIDWGMYMNKDRQVFRLIPGFDNQIKEKVAPLFDSSGNMSIGMLLVLIDRLMPRIPDLKNKIAIIGFRLR